MQNEKEKFKEDFVRRLVRFSVNVISFSEQIKSRRALWPIADQIIRSATSVGANVVEAKSSSSKRDYLHFFEIALKSASETKYWLIVIRESETALDKDTTLLLNECEEIGKILGASVLTMKGK